MSFELNYGHLVEPRSSLIDRIRSRVANADLAEYLLERQLIHKRYVRGHGGDEANIVQIKLAYLSRVSIDTRWDTPDQFQQIFGAEILSVELFDHWWTLTGIDEVEFDELEKFLLDARYMIDRPISD